MNIDWNNEIAKKTALQAQLMELSNLVSHAPPKSPASEEQIQTVERLLGFRLDTQYSQFLRHANGWENFLFETMLFGTDDLLGRTGLSAHAWHHLGLFSPDGNLHEVFNFNGESRNLQVQRNELLPIGDTTESLHMYFIAKPNSLLSGHVIMIQGSSVTEYDDFFTFFMRSMADDQFYIDEALKEKWRSKQV